MGLIFSIVMFFASALTRAFWLTYKLLFFSLKLMWQLCRVTLRAAAVRR